jgi:hypothetical protein
MNSSDIQITSFRQILILPLTLVGAENSVSHTVHDFAKSLQNQSGWIEERDHLAHLGAANDNSAYAEFVYFHAYIQDFLYDRAGLAASTDSEPAIRLFRRTNAGQFDVSVNIDGQALGEGEAIRLDVMLPIARMNLYLFELGVVILVIEVALERDPKVKIGGTERPMSLAHAQALQNVLRRIYPPYFKKEHIDQDTAENIPEYPASLRWSGQAQATRLKPSEWIAQVAFHRRNPIDPVWRCILAPLPIEESSQDTGRRWRQIIDERIPSMVYLGIRGPSGVERKDFARLCFLDDPGRDYPYSESFLEGFEQKHCYDRHWFGTYGTRYLFSGYSMVMFGTGEPGDKNDSFHHVLSEHFRRHYFQMGLLIQLQFSALLSLSQRVSEAVKDKRTRGREEFRRQMLEIEDEVLAFEQRYWFTQVSNQLQAREIYDRWLEITGVSKIYSEVRDQVRAANAYLDAREQAAQTSATTRLSVIATFGVIGGAAFAFLGMNVLASPDFLAAFGVSKDLSAAQSVTSGGSGRWQMATAHLAVFFGVLLASCALGRLLLSRYSESSTPKRPAGRERRSVSERLNGDLIRLAAASFFLMIGFILIAFVLGLPAKP